jgi:site-specific recombinase XerD
MPLANHPSTAMEEHDRGSWPWVRRQATHVSGERTLFAHHVRATIRSVSTGLIPNETSVHRLAKSFCEKSLSGATRATYKRVVTQFFAEVDADPLQVTPDDVRRWRDGLVRDGARPATVALKLSVVRSLYDYLHAAGMVRLNPASPKLVPPPDVEKEGAGRALSLREVRHLLAGPDRSSPAGARDFALMQLLARTGLRAAEACSLRVSSIGRIGERWVLTAKVKGGRERTIPLPDDVKASIDAYLALDASRRERLRPRLATETVDSYLFLPHTGSFGENRALTVRSVERIVARWAGYGRVGHVSPHDLRRTAITRAFDLGLSHRQVQAMSGHRDPRTVMRYDRNRFDLEQNAINFLHYTEES